jgi:hypothetical protein
MTADRARNVRVIPAGLHPCPIRRCPRDVPEHLLTCGIHWRMVPPALQRAVYAAYDHGRGMGTPALASAHRAAVRAVNDRLERTDDA